MFIKLTSFLAFVFFSGTISSQDDSSLRLHFQGYNLIFPGIELAYQYPILNHSFGEKKPKQFIVHASPVLDFYRQIDNHSGLGLSAELNSQLLFQNQFTLEAYGGLGFQQAILAGTVYEIDETGNFVENKLKANTYLIWKAGIGIGKIIHRKNGNPMLLSLRTGVRKNSSPGRTITPNMSIGLNLYLTRKS